MIVQEISMTKLNVGDVFEVRNEMAVYAAIPARFIYTNAKPDDAELRQTEVVVGRPRLNAVTKDETLDTTDFIGEYVVEAARMTGGGTGHGPHDIYPDGWQITARKLRDGAYDPNGKVVFFYQSGSFSVVNPDVPVLRTMTRTVNFI